MAYDNVLCECAGKHNAFDRNTMQQFDALCDPEVENYLSVSCKSTVFIGSGSDRDARVDLIS